MEVGLFFLLLTQSAAPGLPFYFVPHGVPQEWHLNIRLAGHLMMPFGVSRVFRAGCVFFLEGRGGVQG